METAAAVHLRPTAWRGFFVGILLLPLNTLWVLYMELIGGHGPYCSTISLFFNVVFIMVFAALANAAVRRLRPGLALSRLDLIIVYVFLTISTSLSGLDMFKVLISVIASGYWFATPQNHWDTILSRSTPDWLLVSDREALYGYWNGSSTLYQWPVIHAWSSPVLWWTGFTVVLVFVSMCLSVLMRPLWSDRERLTFPIIQLPAELTDPATRLLRSRVLWIGFGIAAAIDLINGLNAIYPSIPAVPLVLDLSAYFRNAPWSGVGWLPVYLSPAVIGLCFLMPVEILFSCVFFFFWWKALYVVAVAAGFNTGYTGLLSESAFPFANEQMFGGFLAVALASVLTGRHYFRRVWRRLLGRPSEVEDAAEGMPLRAAAVGGVVGVALLVAFSLHAGMSLSVALAFFAIYYLLALAVARVRAEFGSPVHDFHFTGPDYTLSYVVGTVNLRQQDLGLLTQYFWFNRAYRGHPIADSLEGLQLAARSRHPGRAISVAVVLATFLGMAAGFWGLLHFGYKNGAVTWGSAGFGWEAFGRLQSWVQNPKPANLVAPVAMAVGFGVTLALAAARMSIIGWPLHPVAYALSASWSIHLVWASMLVAWAAKVGLLRYGGLRVYRDALPFFYGLILGEALVGCCWPLVGLVFHVPSYNFFGG